MRRSSPRPAKTMKAPLGQAQGPTSVSLQSPCRCLRRYGPCRGDRRHRAHTEDGKAVPDALPDNPGEVLADSAYRVISAARYAPRVEVRASSQPLCGGGTRPKARRLEPTDPQNCSRIEKIFGTCKRSYDLRRMRWRGLAKAAVQIRRTAIAYSMKHSLMVASSRPSLKPSHRFRDSAPEIPWRSIRNALPALFAAVSDVQPPTDTNFVFARSETSHPRLCAADGAALPKQSILWMHLIQTIDFTDQNNFH
ncbi:transposase [Mesorhizobium sp. M1027]|uniref:transposase n=1 Tax=Mesorhizobium sp. M1027 TaxID=2957050 RepID=UPI0033362579